MKFVVLLLAAVSLVSVGAAPPNFIPSTVPTTAVPIISYEEVRDMANQYSLTYTTGDGIASRSRGRLIPNFDNTGNVLAIEGEVIYTSPEGRLISFKYIADDKGFRYFPLTQ